MQQVTSTSSLINNFRTEDPRSPLQKLDRKQLRAFCKHYNLEYTITMPATTLREIVAGAGYDGTQPFTYPAPREATPVQEPKPQDPPVMPDVARMSPPQLRKICRLRGIEKLPDGKPITNRAKKDELLQALMANPVVSQDVPQMGLDNG